MFAGKTQNGAAPAGPAVPSGLQMLLKSMGFDPNAFLQNIATMMQEIGAARADFITRFESLRTGQGQLYAQQQQTSDAVLAAIQAQGAEQCARLDRVIAQMEANNKAQAAALEEILQCLKKRRK